MPIGMKKVRETMEAQQNRGFQMLPLAVKEHFKLTEANYKPENFPVTVTVMQRAGTKNFTTLTASYAATRKT